MLEYTYFEQKNNPHFFPNLWPTDQTLALPGGQPARLGEGEARKDQGWEVTY
jgi:hypothetical protein